MVVKLFKFTVAFLVGVFSICGLVMLFFGALAWFRPAQTIGTYGFGGGISFGFLKLLAIAVVLFLVGVIGLTRLGRFTK